MKNSSCLRTGVPHFGWRFWSYCVPFPGSKFPLRQHLWTAPCSRQLALQGIDIQGRCLRPFNHATCAIIWNTEAPHEWDPNLPNMDKRLTTDNHTIQFCHGLNNPCLIPTKHMCTLGLPHDRTHRSLFSDAVLAWKLDWFGLNQSAMFINARYDFQSASQLDLGWAWWQPWWQNWACRSPTVCGRWCWCKMFKSFSLNS